VKRVLRILLNAATVLSLLLCVATVALWVRGYFYQDGFGYTRKAGGQFRSWGLSNFGGSVIYMSASGALTRRDPEPGWTWGSGAKRADSFLVRWSHYGFWGFSSNMYGGAADGGIPFTQAGVPHWFIVLITGMLPAGRGIRFWLRNRRNYGTFCRKCGYDLRATPDRCPECGAITAAA
jgi:hypothetical protein